jgi:para-aminobenzoate synthetase / 4-amino-4-deoxychorismate lyase
MISPTCFALLDDGDASADAPRSRLYTDHAVTLDCQHARQLPALLEKMQQALHAGQHAVGLFSYELGVQLQGLSLLEPEQGLAQVLLFNRCERLDAHQVAAWIAERERATADMAPIANSPSAGITHLERSVSEPQFGAALARIHAYLEAGDTYQVNYTYRLRFCTHGSLFSLYRRLRKRQPVPYGALIGLPDGRAILSLSPELFAHHQEGTITARPMKGTAAASCNQAQDAIRAAMLATDLKTRAENLMIVDLLRNDFGRIAQLGSVRVPQLFQVSRYGSVLQMTSTIKARLRDDVTLHDIFAALYPCGSIIGAPKRRTMQIIRELETDPRGYYTGAIGWFDAAARGQRIGNFCLSVPIRTLLLQAAGADGARRGEMGIGAGIVHDSEPAAEYAECELKAHFLTGLESI